MGLFVSAMDPTAGQFSVVLALVFVLPQFVLSGKLVPNFYQGSSCFVQALASAVPAKWGLEMLLNAYYQGVQWYRLDLD